MRSYNINNTYCLSPGYHLILLNDNQVCLSNLKRLMQSFEGIHASILKELMHRPFSTLELMEALKQQFAPPYVVHALDILEQNNFIITEATFEKLKYTQRSLLPNLLQWPEQPATSQLPSLFFAETWGQVKHKLNGGLSEPILPIIVGREPAFIGPIVNGKNDICVECISFKMYQNNSFDTWLQRHKASLSSASIYVSHALMKGLQNVLAEIASAPSLVYQQMVYVNEKGKKSLHQIIRRPCCSYCGNASLMATSMESPIVLQNNSSASTYTYGYRTVKPNATWKRFKHLIDPVMGIVTKMDTICRLHKEGMYVYAASYAVVPMKKHHHSADFYAQAYGKGTSAIASKVSALCEAIERASLRYYGDEPVVYGTIQEIGTAAVVPHSFQHFHPLQIEQPNATHALGAVPRMMDEQEPIAWLPAWSLRDQERRFLPLDAVLYGHDKLEHERVAIFESNGLSAGNTLEEAILQGLLELIERDAVAIWWFNKLPRPTVDISLMAPDPWFGKAQTVLREQGWSVCFLDLTIDTGIPVIAAVGEKDGAYLTGYGCHPDLRLALNRALTELIQVKALMQPVKPPKGYEDIDYLRPSIFAKKFPPIPLDVTASQGLRQMIQRTVDHLALLDIDTIVLNGTRPEIGLPVVKIVCPGLRAFRPRFGAGRLYEIPVKLGLQDQPASIEQLNPMWLTIQPFKDLVIVY